MSIKKIFGNKLIIILTGLLLFFAGLSVWSLRNNNLNMIKLREAVYTADRQNGNVETALDNLRQYVYSHMNTNLRSGQNFDSDEPPIQLVNRFNRALEAEQARVAALGGANKVYIEAQSKCEVSSLPLTARAQCVQDYVSTYGNGIPQLNLPPKELYTFDFVSPLWSADFAGFMILVTIVTFLAIISEILYLFIVKSKK
jgi:preprotein translocase subunit SecF